MRHTRRVAKRTRYYPSERVGALSDGVFAIVLTLLVLELRLPTVDTGSDDVWRALIENGHEIVGWLVSFVVLARIWAIHHDTFATIRKISSKTVLVNLVFLATISLVPFASKLVGRYEFDEPAAIIVFSVMLGLTGLTLGWVIASAEDDARIHPGQTRTWAWRAQHHLLIVPLVSVLAILATFLHPAIGLLILGIEAVVALILLVTLGSDDASADLEETPTSGRD